MVYRLFRPLRYIIPRQPHRTDEEMKKGKTMTMILKTITHVIWDFPVMIFNMLRGKIAKIIADRALADERGLNG